MEFIPAFLMALFAGHIVDQSEKRNLLLKCIAAFSLISIGLYVLTLESVVNYLDQSTILYSIYMLVFFGGFFEVIFWTNNFFFGCIDSPQIYIS